MGHNMKIQARRTEVFKHNFKKYQYESSNYEWNDSF